MQIDVVIATRLGVSSGNPRDDQEQIASVDKDARYLHGVVRSNMSWLPRTPDFCSSSFVWNSPHHLRLLIRCEMQAGDPADGQLGYREPLGSHRPYEAVPFATPSHPPAVGTDQQRGFRQHQSKRRLPARHADLALQFLLHGGMAEFLAKELLTSPIVETNVLDAVTDPLEYLMQHELLVDCEDRAKVTTLQQQIARLYLQGLMQRLGTYIAPTFDLPVREERLTFEDDTAAGYKIELVLTPKEIGKRMKKMKKKRRLSDVIAEDCGGGLVTPVGSRVRRRPRSAAVVASTEPRVELAMGDSMDVEKKGDDQKDRDYVD